MSAPLSWVQESDWHAEGVNIVCLNHFGLSGLLETWKRSHMEPVFSPVLIHFSCLGESCKAVLLQSSRNVSWTTKLVGLSVSLRMSR